MRLALFTLALLPTPALAAFDCTLTQQCGGGTCEPFTGGPLLVKESGDVWAITIGDQRFDGYSASTVVAGGEVSIVIPPQDGMSGLISIYPSGEIIFTAHSDGGSAVAITGTGTCAGEGG
jgi:hypothetical protein